MDPQPIAHIKCYTGQMTVTPTWTEAKVGTTAITSRKQIIIFNRSAQRLYWSFSDTTDIRHANALAKNGYMAFSLSEGIPIYLRTATAGARAIINELS